MKVTFEFEHPFQFVDLLEHIVETTLAKTECCAIDPEHEQEQRFIDADGNIYTADEMNDFLINSDGIGAP